MSKWDESEYSIAIRAKPETRDKIKEIKGDKSLAAKLEEIINYYLKMHNI